MNRTTLLIRRMEKFEGILKRWHHGIVGGRVGSVSGLFGAPVPPLPVALKADGLEDLVTQVKASARRIAVGHVAVGVGGGLGLAGAGPGGRGGAQDGAAG
jgi:hypothetical protein